MVANDHSCSISCIYILFVYAGTEGLGLGLRTGEEIDYGDEEESVELWWKM